MLDRKRKFVEPFLEGAVSLGTDRYHDCLFLSRQLVDMQAHATYLNRKKKAAADGPSLQSVEFEDTNTQTFLQVINDSIVPPSSRRIV